MNLKLGKLAFDIIVGAAVAVAASTSQAKLEVHEWGTFTSLVGSNGVTQNGMYHEDEELPAFVHGFGALGNIGSPTAPPVSNPTPPGPPPRPRCENKACFGRTFMQQSVITQKMETPVLYFYSDIEQRVSVNVKFPQGIITETFPAPIKTFPIKSETPVIANGDTTFVVDVLNSQSGNLPEVEAGNIYGHARNVASNVVRTGSELEKFIFYRGLGRFQPGMKITSQGGELRINSDQASLPQAAFLVHVDQSGHGNLIELPPMTADTTTVVSAEQIAKLQNHSGSTQTYVPMKRELMNAGLKPDEAKAMLDTWKHGYLQVPGLRLLYVLSNSEVEQTLPLSITPQPDSLKRVFVGRMEVLLDTEEARILNEIKTHLMGFRVASLGRFAEPMLRRVMQVHLDIPAPGMHMADPKITNMIQRFIQQASGATAGETVIQ